MEVLVIGDNIFDDTADELFGFLRCDDLIISVESELTTDDDMIFGDHDLAGDPRLGIFFETEIEEGI